MSCRRSNQSTHVWRFLRDRGGCSQRRSSMQRRLTDLAEMIMTRCDASEIDQWFVHGVITQPGDPVVFSDLLSELAVAKTLPELERQVNLGHSSVLVSRVRSRKGYLGNVLIG